MFDKQFRLRPRDEDRWCHLQIEEPKASFSGDVLNRASVESLSNVGTEGLDLASLQDPLELQVEVDPANAEGRSQQQFGLESRIFNLTRGQKLCGLIDQIERFPGNVGHAGGPRLPPSQSRIHDATSVNQRQKALLLGGEQLEQVAVRPS